MTASENWRPGRRVAIVGAGPSGVSAGLALLKRGFDVRIYERNPAPKPLGGVVLLSVPVLAVLRDYGIDINDFGSFTVTEFRNHKGKLRARLPFNSLIEQSFGIKGWYYGMLRSNAFAKMMALLPVGTLISNRDFERYEDTGSDVTLHFKGGGGDQTDILIGADGVRSKVSVQAFGEPDLFHVGLRVWLAWCDAEKVPDLPRNMGNITHSRHIQASYFPMLHDGKPGFEWWIVEPVAEHTPEPICVKSHVQGLLANWAQPLPRFPEVTDFDRQIFCWDIYNRPSLSTWSSGRVVCLGDAVHPVSPYAAYGMGMAIEDGYFLGRALAGVDLTDSNAVQQGFAGFEQDRVAYVNHHVEFARKLGNVFHQMPAPLAVVRDWVFDRTPLLSKMISKDYLADQEAMSLSLKELHVR
ncbi:FAD-dependent oxidoreductase [Halioxenophilus aromaticivorans]|uniref:FAD-dependent monooxygenase n=1 Tax=Halioxenophilus aromaticivorans TaxID=1306992 RepID=A0AAV3U5J1_9ALTE